MAIAQTSLYIPGFDPQPVTANNLGVGPDGQTTWLIAPGVSSGTLDDNGFFGPGESTLRFARTHLAYVSTIATLIAGPSSAEIIYHDPGMGVDVDEKCGISGTEADCTAVLVLNGVTSTMVNTETVAPFEVQGGGAAAPTGAPGAPNDTASAGSSPSSPPAKTSDSASTPSPPASSPPAGGSPGSSSQSSGSPGPTNNANAATSFGVPSFTSWFAAAAFAVIVAA